jgi:hypothetical protein
LAGKTPTRETEVKLELTITFKDVIGTAQKTVRSLDPQSAKVLVALLDERMQQLGVMELKLSRPSDISGYSMAPRLVDRLGQLLNKIDRVLAAPTPYQVEHFNELKAEFLKDMGDVNNFVEKQIPEINSSKLRAAAFDSVPVPQEPSA